MAGAIACSWPAPVAPAGLENEMPRRRRKRYRDTDAIPSNGTGVIEPDWRKRHRKRKRDANRQYRKAGIAFASIGGWLAVLNNGEHWQIHFPKGRLLQWWPSTAKLVVNEEWKKGIHCHTWQDLFRYAKG